MAKSARRGREGQSRQRYVAGDDMPSHFCLSVCFLDAAFHGRGDSGKSEWPPSPHRVFQALVAAGARQNGGDLGIGAH